MKDLIESKIDAAIKKLRNAKNRLRDEEDYLITVDDYLNEAVSHIDSAIWDIELLEKSLSNSTPNDAVSDTTESE